MNSPSVAEVVRVARRNRGLESCKEVSSGLLDNTPEDEREPREIRSILCDGRIVGDWRRYRDAGARERYGAPVFNDRPYFVNGNVVVTTGEAVMTDIDPDAWARLPTELRRRCACGEVRQPTR